MGIFDKIFSGTIFHKKEKEELPVDQESSRDRNREETTKKSSLQKSSQLAAVLFFQGKQYTVTDFDLEFKQDMNMNGNIDSRVYGGIITATISDIPDEQMNWWIVDSFHRHDGEFRFFERGKEINEGAQQIILFQNAHCSRYKKIIDPKAGVLTTLTIHPRKVRVGNEEFENSWRS